MTKSPPKKDTAKVTAIGGIFIRSKDSDALLNWYRDHLGITLADDFPGAVFQWRNHENPKEEGATILSAFKHDTDYFGPDNSPFMVNFRVDDLDTMLTQLRAAGCTVDDNTETMEGLGRFGWVTDPEGRKIELWQAE